MNLLEIPKTIIKLVNILVISTFKTIFLDFPKNIKDRYVYSFNMEKRKQIQYEADTKKKLEFLTGKVKRLERLVYSIFNDPEYTKKDSGKIDLKELEKEVK